MNTLRVFHIKIHLNSHGKGMRNLIIFHSTRTIQKWNKLLSTLNIYPFISNGLHPRMNMSFLKISSKCYSMTNAFNLLLHQPKKRNDENEHSSKVVCTAMVQEKKYLFLTSSYLQSRWKRFTKNFKRRKSEHCVALNSIKRHDTIVILFWFPRFFRSLIFHPEYFAFAEFYCF